MQRIIIEVNSEIKDFVKGYAKERGTTMSYVLRGMIDEFRQKAKRPKRRSVNKNSRRG